MKKCPYCGAEIEASAQKCKYCGEWVSDENKGLPKEIKHFNWGAFLLNWIWGVMNKKYITLFIVPVEILMIFFVLFLANWFGIILFVLSLLISLGLMVWFGLKGNEWAWKSKTWNSFDEFNEAQRSWVRLWLVLFILGLIFSIKAFVILIIVGSMA